MAQTERTDLEGKMTKEAVNAFISNLFWRSQRVRSVCGCGMPSKWNPEAEQPFMMSVPASEADPSYPEDETILVQGIIDAWFEGMRLFLWTTKRTV